MRKKRRVLLVILSVVACVLMSIFARLDNWKRDLTTNYARLDASSPDPSLRTLVLPSSRDEVADRLDRWASKTPRWSVESRQESGSELQVHLTHRTALFRFIDDIHVRLTEQEGGTRVDAESRSRFGKGDLGQNPRNLRELRRGLQE